MQTDSLINNFQDSIVKRKMEEKNHFDTKTQDQNNNRNGRENDISVSIQEMHTKPPQSDNFTTQVFYNFVHSLLVLISAMKLGQLMMSIVDFFLGQLEKVLDYCSDDNPYADQKHNHKHKRRSQPISWLIFVPPLIVLRTFFGRGLTLPKISSKISDFRSYYRSIQHYAMKKRTEESMKRRSENAMKKQTQDAERKFHDEVNKKRTEEAERRYQEDVKKKRAEEAMRKQTENMRKKQMEDHMNQQNEEVEETYTINIQKKPTNDHMNKWNDNNMNKRNDDNKNKRNEDNINKRNGDNMNKRNEDNMNKRNEDNMNKRNEGDMRKIRVEYHDKPDNKEKSKSNGHHESKESNNTSSSYNSDDDLNSMEFLDKYNKDLNSSPESDHHKQNRPDSTFDSSLGTDEEIEKTEMRSGFYDEKNNAIVEDKYVTVVGVKQNGNEKNNVLISLTPEQMSKLEKEIMSKILNHYKTNPIFQSNTNNTSPEIFYSPIDSPNNEYDNRSANH